MHRTMDYPQTRTENVKDTLWGIEVADPYRWLEDDRSEETMAWVDEQSECTQGYLNSLDWRQPLRDRFETLFNYEKIGMPRKIGDRYFLSKNDGLQNQSVWYVRETLDGEDELFNIQTPEVESREQKKLRMYEEIFRKREEQELRKLIRKTKKRRLQT